MQTYFGRDYPFLALFEQKYTFPRDTFWVDPSSQSVTTKKVWATNSLDRRIKEENTVCKCECEIQRNIVWEYIKTIVWTLEMGEGICPVCYFTLLYKKGIKQKQNRPMETTSFNILGMRYLYTLSFN